MNWQDRKALIRTTFVEFFGEKSLRHGAALSYYFILALVPMLYLSVTYVGMVLGEDSVRQTISSVMTKWIGLTNPETVLGFLDQVDFSKSSIWLRALGILALLFSCSAIFNSLRQSINDFYNIKVPEIGRKRLIIRKLLTRLLSMSFVIGASVILVVLYFAQTIFLGFVTELLKDAEVASTWVLSSINVILPILTNLALFWFVFKYMHDGKVSGKIAFRGSVLTSLLLFVGHWLIKFYITNYFFGAHGGVAGTMLVILVWVYYSSQIIFFGAKYIAVFARMKGTPIQHALSK